MFSNRIAFAALAVVCIGAAASGGYLATRQATPTSAALSADAVHPAAEPVKAVQETEAIVMPPAEAAPKPVDTPAPVPQPAARKAAPRPTPTAKTTSARASAPPTLDRSWPSNSGPASAPPPTAPVDPAVTMPQAPVENRLPLPEPVPEPQPSFEELVVAADSVVGLQLESALSSERARVEDPVEARVVRDVRVGRSVAIPAGSRAQGSVVVVERGGKFKDRARLGIRFHTLVLADGSRLPISTDTIYRYGDAPGDGSAKKIGGGAVAGAILGAIIGGAKGAAVGATAGAGGGTAMVMSGDRSAAEFPAGSDVTARILSPVTVTLDR